MSNTEPNIFFEERMDSTRIDPIDKENECPLSIPYLKKGDSNVYVDQFLVKVESPQVEVEVKLQEKQDQNYSRQDDEEFQLEKNSKFNPSAFHNFQKHLTVCLKHVIQIASEDKAHKEHQVVAAKLWKVFKNTSISTKKILHYLLGEKNEHKITEQGMKEYGILKIYEQYGEKLMRQARIFLANQTLRQIKEGRLDEYITNKKLKDKEKFKKYVEIFVDELEKGYLKKRLPKDKVNYLLRA